MRSRKLIRLSSIAVLIVFALTACAPLPPPGTALTDEQRAEAQRNCIARYSAAGAVGGALVGALLGGRGSRGVGAAIGAIAGGALAFTLAYGRCMSLYSDLKSYPVAGAQETAQRIGYNPSQGNIMKIEDLYLNPAAVAPGGKVMMGGSYYIMAPEGTKEVKVVETRSLEMYDSSENQWKTLGDAPSEVTVAMGTRRLDGHFDIPKEVADGTYRITVKVSGNGIEDARSQNLTVKKGLAMEPSATPPPGQYMQTAAVAGAKVVEPAAKRQIAVIKPSVLSVKQESSMRSSNIATVKQFDMFEVLESRKSEGKFWHRIVIQDNKSGCVLDSDVNLKE